MKLKFYFILIISVTISIHAFASLNRVKSSKYIEIKKHEVVDIVFKSTKSSSPFDVELCALFTSSDGTQMSVPGFYNGGNEWVIRFSSSESGKWKYVTQSSIRKLNNIKGELTVKEEIYNNRLGSLFIDNNNPRRFQTDEGGSYFSLGFECDFLFALDYDSEKTDNLNQFLDKVSENGFNQIVMNVYANDVVWDKDPALSENPQYEFVGNDDIFPFNGSNSNPDYSSLNIRFFKNLDRVIKALNDRNIVSHLMIYVWNKNVNWPEPMSEADNMYFDYVIKRYQAFSNIIWDVSKEAIFYGNVGDEYINERILRVKKLDAYKRLLSVHDFGFCKRNISNVDFVSHQCWRLSIYDDMLRNYREFKDKPVVNIEHGGYEECDFDVFCGNYINAEYCLRRNYECLFAGVYSTYYWQGCSWNVIVYDWMDRTTGYRPKMEYYNIMQKFFHEYKYADFHPLPEYNNSGYCMTDDKGTYLFYLPKESFKSSVGKIMDKARKLSFQWFNTHTGEYSTVETEDKMEIFSMPASPWHMKNDAILIIKILEYK